MAAVKYEVVPVPQPGTRGRMNSNQYKVNTLVQSKRDPRYLETGKTIFTGSKEECDSFVAQKSR